MKSYSVTDKLKRLLLQHDDPVTSVIRRINLLVRIRMLMWFVFVSYDYSSFSSLCIFYKLFIYSFVFVFIHFVCLQFSLFV